LSVIINSLTPGLLRGLRYRRSLPCNNSKPAILELRKLSFRKVDTKATTACPLLNFGPPGRVTKFLVQKLNYIGSKGIIAAILFEKFIVALHP